MKESLIIYKASAGSGKTFTLAQNYLVQLLSKGGSHRYILAVTFTNKATTEMKQRILAYLYDLAEGRATGPTGRPQTAGAGGTGWDLARL